MEDVKELSNKELKRLIIDCFNPCFNGRCKRTKQTWGKGPFAKNVSILVLMEDVKELSLVWKPKWNHYCFNPCFNGRCKRTIK